MISSSKRILACKIQNFKDFSFICHHLFVFILFIKVRIFCSESEHQFDFILQLVETGIFSQHKAAHRHTSYLKKKLEQTLCECKMISYLQDCEFLSTRKFQINFHQTKDRKSFYHAFRDFSAIYT